MKPKRKILGHLKTKITFFRIIKLVENKASVNGQQFSNI